MTDKELNKMAQKSIQQAKMYTINHYRMKTLQEEVEILLNTIGEEANLTKMVLAIACDDCGGYIGLDPSEIQYWDSSGDILCEYCFEYS